MSCEALTVTCQPAKPFHPFTSLPTELRLQIYKHIFQDTMPVFIPFDTTNEPPPILLTSKSIRAEALPIFYRQCRFVLEFCCQECSTVFGAEVGEQRLYKEGRAWIEGLEREHMAEIKSFQLRAMLPKADRLEYYAFNFDIYGQSEGPRIELNEIVKGEERAYTGIGPLWEALIIRRLDETVKEMGGRFGKHEFRREDLEAFEAALTL